MIVFLTVYLGLIAGKQPIEMRVDPAVRMVRLLIDGKEAGVFTKPPWRAIVDLGPTIQPRELTAVGFNENGEEIARATQVLNLPRATAELEIIVDRDAKGTPKRVTLDGRHVSYADPRRTTLKLDAVPLSLDRRHTASLPPLDMKRPHVLSGEMRFADGTVARREVVFGGEFTETMPTQLSPTAFVRTGAGDAPPPADDCFLNNGTPLRVSSVEKSSAILIVVRDPDPSALRHALLFTAVIDGSIDTAHLRHAASVDPDTTVELMSPAADRVVVPDQPTAILFPSFPNPMPKEGLYWFLTTTKIRGTAVDAPRRWADAVAVAAVTALNGGRRRAVILILGSDPDASYHTPESVRQYLASVGVPLFVWSPTGPRPELAGSWGPVEDVSALEWMESATEKVKQALDVQRIAWIYADPLTALNAHVKEGCGYARLAQ